MHWMVAPYGPARESTGVYRPVPFSVRCRVAQENSPIVFDCVSTDLSNLRSDR